MNPVIPVSTQRLHQNPDNPLPPLPEDEFNELRNSIGKYGIIEHLFIVQDQDRPHDYIVIAGNHRLKAAQELGIPEIPCMVIRQNDIEAAYETELYRRTLTKEEREFYAQKIREITKKRREENIKKSLIEPLYLLYSQGGISTAQVNLIISLSKEEQHGFHDMMSKQTNLPTQNTLAASPTEQDHQVQQEAEEREQAHQEELEQARQKQQQLESRLKAMEAAKQEAEKARDDLERRNQKAKKLLQEKMEELEEVREQTTVQAAATIREKVTEQIIEIQTQVSQSANAIREKDKELEQLREERDKAKRDLLDTERKIKLVWTASRDYYDSVKDAMNVIFKPDMLRKRIAIVKNELEMLETVWTSYAIEANLRKEVLASLEDIQKKVNSMVKTLPQIEGPQLPVITKAILEDPLRRLPPQENEARLLQ